jgi:hypothetical protein
MVVVGVGGRRSVAQWVVLLASAPSRSDRIARVCGGTVGTVNIGFRAPFIVTLRERGSTVIQGKRLRSERGSDWFLNPKITFLTVYTTKKW